jgi:hypothetical protein
MKQKRDEENRQPSVDKLLMQWSSQVAKAMRLICPLQQVLYVIS